MLRELIVTVTWTLVISTIVVCASTVFGFWWMVESRRRRNRFGRHDRVTAPLHWLYGPGEPPRLHRRLLNAVAAGRRAAAVIDGRRLTPSTISSLVDELEAQAGVVDDGLILASRLATVPRQRLLSELRPGVAEVEEVAERLVRMATDVEQAGRPSLPLARLHEHLDAIEHAHRELSDIQVRLPRAN